MSGNREQARDNNLTVTLGQVTRARQVGCRSGNRDKARDNNLTVTLHMSGNIVKAAVQTIF